MSLPEPINYRIGEADHYALWALMSRMTCSKGLLWSLPILMVIGALNGFANESVFDAMLPVGVGALAGLAIVALSFATLKSRARKLYRESVALQEEMTLLFHEDGFEIEQASGRFRSRWVDMVRWHENSAIMAIFPNRYTAFVFPKNQVSEDIVKHLRQQTILSGLPRPWKLRK